LYEVESLPFQQGRQHISTLHCVILVLQVMLVPLAVWSATQQEQQQQEQEQQQQQTALPLPGLLAGCRTGSAAQPATSQQQAQKQQQQTAVRTMLSAVTH
jgi:hypothetical protein